GSVTLVTPFHLKRCLKSNLSFAASLRKPTGKRWRGKPGAGWARKHPIPTGWRWHPVTRDVKASTLVLGEVLIDFFSGPADRSVPGARVFPFEGVPGGAPANVAAHLAVRGLPVSLITGFADDPLGEELKQMLAERGIDLTHCLTYPQSRSPLATVISLPDGERTFRLYLEGSCLEKLTPALLTPEVWNGVDWVHFGSVMMAFRGPNELTHALAAGAKERGIVVSLDVNIRADL